MQSSFRFSNLLGATYQGGSVQFTPDGNTLLSPVGNRVNAVDLVQGRCNTLAPENREDISVLALSPDSRILLSIDRKGHALVINFLRGVVLCRINFKSAVQSAKWSPDSRWLAVTHDRRVQLWRAPTLELGWQFVQHRTFGGHHDDIVEISWAPNSLFFATCGKDMAVRIWSLNPMDGFEHMALVEHRSAVRGAFFSEDMHHLFSLSRDGVLVSLKYNLKEGHKESKDKPLYCQPGEWSLAAKAYCQQPTYQKVMRCAFDGPSRLLAAGFSGGIFMLFEMPELQALQTLSLGNQPLDAVALGAKGDWLAVGSAGVGQLLVWEWRSETYVLKQQGHHYGVQCTAFSPAGPTSLRREKSLTTADSRPEDRGNSALSGRLLATGGYDGKIKLFNSQSGLCFVTFAEHTAPVSDLCFTPQGNAILSASQDGSVRAFDLLRYRNFRTFASPDGLCQFASVGVDGGGEIVAASAVGGKYAIYVWSIQTGNILEVLVGHTSQVSSLKFSTSPTNPGQVCSASWDGSLRVWDLYANSGKGGAGETLQCPSSVLSVAFDPRGNDTVAASCLSGQVLFWNVSLATQIGSIEGLRDIQSGRQWKDRFAATHMKGIKPGQELGKKKGSDGVSLNQHFSSIAYVKSGELLLCGSRNSPHLCLYDTSSYSLAIRYTISTNRSLSGTQVMLNSANMTEQGVSRQELDLSDSDVDDMEVNESNKRRKQAGSLPGVTVGEAKDAYSERELHVWDVAFSADSQQFAAATTHGVFVYTADMGLGTPSATSGVYGSDGARFVPQMLTKNVSAPSVLEALKSNELSKALILALALNDRNLIRKVYESVPVRQIPIVVASIGAPLLPAILLFLSAELKPSTGSPHFQFHISWIQALIDLHFLTLMELSTGKASARTGASIEAAGASRADVASLCLQLLVELTQRHAAMAKTFDGNRYLLRYLSGAPSTASEKADGDNDEDDEAFNSVAEQLAAISKTAPKRTAEDSMAFFSGKASMPVLDELAKDENEDGKEQEPVTGSLPKKRKKKAKAATEQQ